MNTLSIHQHHNLHPSMDNNNNNKENKPNLGVSAAATPKGILKQSSISKSTIGSLPPPSNGNSITSQSLFYKNQPHYQGSSNNSLNNQSILSHIDNLMNNRENQLIIKPNLQTTTIDQFNFNSINPLPSSSDYASTIQSTVIQTNFSSLRSNSSNNRQAGDIKSYLQHLESKASKKDSSSNSEIQNIKSNSSFSRTQQQQRVPAGRSSKQTISSRNGETGCEFPHQFNYHSAQQSSQSFRQITEIEESDTDSSSSSSSSSSPKQQQRAPNKLSLGIAATQSRCKRSVSAQEQQFPLNSKRQMNTTTNTSNRRNIQNLPEGKEFKESFHNSKMNGNKQPPSSSSAFGNRVSLPQQENYCEDKYANQPQILTAAAAAVGRTFASEQIFCIMCEDYIEANKVDEHSVYCQENQLAITRRIPVKESDAAAAAPAETRYQIEKLNQKILKIKIHLEDIRVSDAIVGAKRIQQYQAYLIDVATQVLATNANVSTALLTDLRVLTKKLEDLENLSNRYIVFSLLVLLDKLAKFTKDKINYVHIEQISASRYVATNPAAATGATNVDYGDNYDGRDEIDTQQDAFTEVSETGRYKQPFYSNGNLNHNEQLSYQQENVSIKSIPFQQNNLHQFSSATSAQQLSSTNRSTSNRSTNQIFGWQNSTQPLRRNHNQINNNQRQSEGMGQQQQVPQLKQISSHIDIDVSIPATKRTFFAYASKLKQQYPESGQVQRVLISDVFLIFANQQTQQNSKSIESFLDDYFSDLSKKCD